MTRTSSRSAQLTLPADNQILVTREFDAPKHLVFRAWTTPELVRKWWHAGFGEVTVVEIDLRVGGKWRYVMVVDDGGIEVGFHGEYREIVPAERLVYTEVFEGAPEGDGAGEEGLNTVSFVEAGGRTTVTMLSEYSSTQVRDAVLATGMESGLQKALDLLEQTAKALA
jgi:uncharacterized protein YndB with AHSA1/START domain